LDSRLTDDDPDGPAGPRAGRFVGAADWDSADVVAFLMTTIAAKNASANLVE
jgi:hypothetical protein